MSGPKHKLHDLANIIGAHTSDACMERLLAFIVSYQAQNSDTPSIVAMMNELKTAESAIRMLLSRLEKSRRIHFVSRNPQRIIVITPDTVLPHETGVFAVRDEARYERFLDAEGRRHLLARFIGEVENEKGRGPTLREMMFVLETSNGAWVHRTAEILAERGLINFGPGVATCLTEKGRQLYGHTTRKQEEKIMDTPNKIIAVKERKTKRKMLSAYARAMQVGKVVAEWEKDGQVPKFVDFFGPMGVGSFAPITNGIKKLVSMGLLEPRRKGAKGALHLTDKGRVKFGVAVKQDVAPEQKPDPEFYEQPKPRKAWPEPQPEPQTTAPVSHSFTETVSLPSVATADLVLELIERGYTVRKN